MPLNLNPVTPVRPSALSPPVSQRGTGADGRALVVRPSSTPQEGFAATLSQGESERRGGFFADMLALVKRAAMHLIPKPPQQTPHYTERALAEYRANRFVDDVEFAQETPSIDVYV